MASALREVARQAGCLAAGAEVGEWIATTFGGELASRRRVLRALAQQPPRTASEVGALTGLGDAQAAEVTARDELSFDELARAAALAPALASAATPAVLAPIGPRIAALDPRARRRLALVAGAAFAVVALVLGWRAAATAGEPTTPAAWVVPAVPQLPIEVEVTVLDVHAVSPAPAAPLPDPAPPASAAPRHPPPASAAPSRSPPAATRPPRPRPPPRPAPPQVKPPEPRATPAPAAVESNPYVYK